LDCGIRNEIDRGSVATPACCCCCAYAATSSNPFPPIKPYLIGMYNSIVDSIPNTEIKLNIDTVVNFLGSKDDDLPNNLTD